MQMRKDIGNICASICTAICGTPISAQKCLFRDENICKVGSIVRYVAQIWSIQKNLRQTQLLILHLTNLQMFKFSNRKQNNSMFMHLNLFLQICLLSQPNSIVPSPWNCRLVDLLSDKPTPLPLFEHVH